MSKDYIKETKAQILEIFDNSPVVLVEIMSKIPEFNGQICAITTDTGGYLPLDYFVLKGCFEKDAAATFGITTKCIDLMEYIENGKPPVVNLEKFAVSAKGILYNEPKARIVENYKSTKPQNLSYLQYEQKPKEKYKQPKVTAENKNNYKSCYNCGAIVTKDTEYCPVCNRNEFKYKSTVVTVMEMSDIQIWCIIIFFVLIFTAMLMRLFL